MRLEVYCYDVAGNFITYASLQCKLNGFWSVGAVYPADTLTQCNLSHVGAQSKLLTQHDSKLESGNRNGD